MATEKMTKKEFKNYLQEVWKEWSAAADERGPFYAAQSGEWLDSESRYYAWVGYLQGIADANGWDVSKP